ncbi:Broad-complex core protein isoform 6, partial [Caligus rogercresseyi]
LLDAEIMKYVTKDEGNGANFYCLKCSFKSTHKTTVKRHVESRHFVTDGFRCDQCGKVYKTRETLSKHLLKIHRAKPFTFPRPE